MKNIFKNKLKILRYILPALILIFIFGIFGIANKKSESTPKTAPPVVESNPTPAYTDFHLLIPSLNIDAPVIADVDGSDKDAYFEALKEGVAHFQGTAKPGEESNIFIFGHSSYYAWDSGKYKTIFENLESIKESDEIILWYKSKEYKYKITETKVVDPSDVSVLKKTSTEQVTLMTCVPVGTDEQRLIVIGKPL